MEAVLRNPDPSSLASVSGVKPRRCCNRLAHVRVSTHGWVSPRRSRFCSSLSIRAVQDSTTIEELDPFELKLKNPAISTSYRIPELHEPNQTVLDAQAKVCTGPTQTRPLNEDQAFKVLQTILKSGNFDSMLVIIFSKFIEFITAQFVFGECK